MNKPKEHDLGFDYRLTKNGHVLIDHHARLVTTLRGKKATDFVKKVEKLDFAGQHQWMARVTGNYKISHLNCVDESICQDGYNYTKIF